MSNDSRSSELVRIWPLLTVGIALCLLTVGPGCKKKKYQDGPQEKGSIHVDAGVSGPDDQRYGSQGAITVERKTKRADGKAGDVAKRNYKNCRKPTPVTSGDQSTPEGALYQVFSALLEKDEETAFSKFYALVDSEYQNKTDARRYWFASARKDNSKAFLRLVYGPNDPSYDICSQRPDGQGAVRIFVGKSPPVGSNPPYVLNKKGDKWLLKTFTPH